MASGSGEGKPPDFPRGLMDRHGAPAGKARLTSLRSPRDLTLGGIPKRVFVPNIPVRRERPAPGLPPEPKKKEPPKERSERGRGRGRGRGGRGRGDSNLVQIQSVFDQGPSIQNVKDPESRRGFGGWGEGGGGGGGGGGRGGGGRGGGGGGGGAVKTFKRDMDVDGKRQKILDMLTRDDFIADWDEDENDVTPLCVPSIRPTAARVKTDMKKPKEEPELDITIKQEPEESAEPISGAGQALGLPSCGPAPAFMNLEQPELTCAELFTDASKSGKEEMILFQLPNQLPGIPAMREEDQQPTTGKDKNDKEEEVKIPQSSLRCFSEGYLGKLRVRKSGKVELVLGDHVLDVSMGIQPSFRQEAVSIRAEEGDKRMTLLGHVQHKMKIMPNFEQLYHAMTMEDT